MKFMYVHFILFSHFYIQELVASDLKKNRNLKPLVIKTNQAFSIAPEHKSHIKYWQWRLAAVYPKNKVSRRIKFLI